MSEWVWARIHETAMIIRNARTRFYNRVSGDKSFDFETLCVFGRNKLTITIIVKTKYLYRVSGYEASDAEPTKMLRTCLDFWSEFDSTFWILRNREMAIWLLRLILDLEQSWLSDTFRSNQTWNNHIRSFQNIQNILDWQAGEPNLSTWAASTPTSLPNVIFNENIPRGAFAVRFSKKSYIKH